MSLLSGGKQFFGLDVGTTAIRLAELRGSGPTKPLVTYAQATVDSQLSVSDAKTDQQKLAAAVRQLVDKAHTATRNVAVGLASQRVFTVLADIERLPANELAKAIHYQADALIPTALSESKLDWVVLGDSPKDHTKLEILLTSVPNKFIEERLDLLESIGLNVISFEPDNLALARALLPDEATATTQMVIDIGHRTTDMVIAINSAPRLTRSIPTGMENITRAAMQNLNIDEKQAEQFVSKFGLSREKLEGQVYQAIIGTVDVLTSEIEKSIKFFQARYPDNKLDRMLVTGGASTLPELPTYLSTKFDLTVEIGNAWRNVSYPANQQHELAAVSNQFGVAVGLAERQE